MIRAGVCGLGIGMAHCAGYLASANAELAAVCDLMPERLDRVGGTFEAGSMRVLKPLYAPELLGKRWEDLGVRTYDALEGMLADRSVDAVSLCTPDYQHAEQATAAIESGKHLLLEKPIALSAADAQRVIASRDRAAAGRALTAVGYEFRVCRPIMEMRRLIAEGAIGPISAFSLHHFRTAFKRDKWEHWIQQERLSGGLIVEETSHWIDLARYITGGEIRSVHAVTTDAIHPDFDYEDIAFIQGRYEDDAIYQISHSLGGFDFDLAITAQGPGGALWCGLKEQRYSALDAGASTYCGVLATGRLGESPEDAVVETYDEEVLEPHLICEYVRRFTATADGSIPPDGTLCTLEEAAVALDVALAARRSARERKEIIF